MFHETHVKRQWFHTQSNKINMEITSIKIKNKEIAWLSFSDDMISHTKNKMECP